MKRTILLLIITLSFAISHGQDTPKTQSPQLEHADKALAEGNYQHALKLYDQVIQQHPEFADAYRSRASVKEHLKDLKGALVDYSIFIERHPEHFEALLGRASVLYKLGRYNEAKVDYTKLLTIPAGETSTIYYQRSASAVGTHQFMTSSSLDKSMIHNYIGLTEMKLKNYSAAVQRFDAALQLQPGNADYYVNRAMAREGLNDLKAKEDYEKALSINPNHTLALHNLGVAERKSGKRNNQFLDKAIESDSTMLYPYLERAYQRFEGGFYKGALEDYTLALSIEANDPEIWLNRGVVREKLNDLKGAYADYTKAISLQDDLYKAWLNRANLLNKQGRFQEAVEDYTVAIAIKEDYTLALYNRAIAYERLKQFEKACQDLKRAELSGYAGDEKLKQKVCP